MVSAAAGFGRAAATPRITATWYRGGCGRNSKPHSWGGIRGVGALTSFGVSSLKAWWIRAMCLPGVWLPRYVGFTTTFSTWGVSNSRRLGAGARIASTSLYSSYSESVLRDVGGRDSAGPNQRGVRLLPADQRGQRGRLPRRRSPRVQNRYSRPRVTPSRRAIISAHST